MELSPETKKRLEEVAVAAFHNLLLGVVDNFVKSLDHSVQEVAQLNQLAMVQVKERVLESV